MAEEQLTVSLRSPSVTVAGAMPPPRLPRKRRGARTAVILIILLVLGGAVGWHSTRTGSPSPGNSGPGASAVAVPGAQEAKSADVIAKVGALIELPQNETPTIATVTDPSKLQDQAFFAKAKTGDIVLIYTTAREAYLYDPVQDKLVAVAPITTNAAGQAAPQ